MRGKCAVGLMAAVLVRLTTDIVTAWPAMP